MILLLILIRYLIFPYKQVKEIVVMCSEAKMKNSEGKKLTCEVRQYEVIKINILFVFYLFLL